MIASSPQRPPAFQTNRTRRTEAMDARIQREAISVPAGKDLHLDWRPLYRDIFFYFASVLYMVRYL